MGQAHNVQLLTELQKKTFHKQKYHCKGLYNYHITIRTYFNRYTAKANGQ